MLRKKCACRSQHGSILFLILLAVVLFAALSYAVTNSMRGEGKSGSGESAQARAAHIVQYAATLEQGVARLRLTNNVPLHMLDFRASGSIVNLGANNSCTSGNCRLFDPAGAGAIAQSLPAGAYYPASRLNLWFATVIIPQVGTDLAEIVVTYPDVEEETCIAINNIVGVTNPSGLPPAENWEPKAAWTGTLTAVPEPSGVSITLSSLYGKKTFCASQPPFSVGDKPMYYFIHVLVER